MEQCRAARAVARADAPTNGTTTPTGERAAAGPQFPYGMRNTAVTYSLSFSTDMAAYEDLPGRHLLAVRNLIQRWQRVETRRVVSFHTRTRQL
jgi:hypothetical protein